MLQRNCQKLHINTENDCTHIKDHVGYHMCQIGIFD